MITLSLNPNRDLSSQFARALEGRRIDLDGGTPDEVHLHTSLAIRWRKMSEAATALLRELRQLRSTSSGGNNYDEGHAPQALKLLIYSATEAFDLYHQTIPKRLEKGRGRSEVKLIGHYREAVKRLRDPVAMICNRMKHEYREIVMGRITSQMTGETTFVYRLNVAHGGVQLPDRVVHRESGFASLERTLHEIVHGLLRADFNAGELVSTLSDNYNAAIELKVPSSLGLVFVLEGLGDRTPTVAHSEPGQFDGVQVLEDKAFLTRIRARKVAEPTARTMKTTIDEGALSVQLLL